MLKRKMETPSSPIGLVKFASETSITTLGSLHMQLSLGLVSPMTVDSFSKPMRILLPTITNYLHFVVGAVLLLPKPPSLMGKAYGHNQGLMDRDPKIP